MAKRSKTGAGAGGVPEGEGAEPSFGDGDASPDAGVEESIDDPSAFDDVPTRPGVVVRML